MNPIAFLRGLTTNVIDSVRDPDGITSLLAAWTERMSADDKTCWQSARNLPDLGELTAQWLEGDIASVPSYAAGHGPSPETTDTIGLLDVLVTLNRAGYVTNESQPGGEEYGTFDERAGVYGFADDVTAERLRSAVVGTRMACEALPVRSLGERRHLDRDWPIGQHMTAATIADPHLGYGVCHRLAVEALCDAWQVVVYDPQFGPNDLWPVLVAAFAGTTVAS